MRFPAFNPLVPKIQIRDLHKRFDGAPLNALEHIHLDIAHNEFVTFVGASGCGKSTLLRTIGGLETHTSGELLVDGQPATGRVLLRADSGFCREGLMAWCEANGVDYALGLPTNAALRADPVIVTAADACAVRRAGSV